MWPKLMENAAKMSAEQIKTATEQVAKEATKEALEKARKKHEEPPPGPMTPDSRSSPHMARSDAETVALIDRALNGEDLAA